MICRVALRSLQRSRCLRISTPPSRRLLATSGARLSKHDDASNTSRPGASGSQEGQSARTDETTDIRYPRDGLRSEPVRGHGGRHFKPTLASFSLEGKVAVLTGAA